MSLQELVDHARTRTPRFAVILGSGLGSLADRLDSTFSIRFGDIPGFPAPSVHGHGGRILIGDWKGTCLLVFQGRIHYYEGHEWERATATVELAHDLGARSLLLTNAAGGINEKLEPGDLMAIRDHITLLGPEEWKFPRPQPLYDVRPFAGTGIMQGTYAALTGPSYETPAEIRALKVIGADVVGMSTAREAERAKALGMQVFAVSCVTNKAAGISTERLDHSEVQQVAGRIEIAEKFANIIDELFVN